jgi:hypothetical protein
MSKRRLDEDYNPMNEIYEKSIKKPNKQQTDSFLTRNQEKIWSLQKKGFKPADIAKSLCLDQGLSATSVSGKQVSNWINYHKKSGKQSTRSISLNNENLRPDRSDNCMSSLFLRMMTSSYFVRVR